MKQNKTADYASFPLELVNGILPELKEVDIVLIRIKGNFLRFLLRKVTDSYWDHAALVLFPKNIKKGRFYNSIIESVKPNGVEVHKLQKYLTKPNKYDIGIKRVPNLSALNRHQVIAFALMNVDTPYYRLSTFKFLLAYLSKRYRKWLLRRQRYSCTGLVQKAFYEAANINSEDKFVFRTDFLSPIELQEITTPADIATSKNSKWIYNERYYEEKNK